jgi:nitroreductase
VVPLRNISARWTAVTRKETTMELSEALSGRRSVRGFKPDPVPRQTLDQIVRSALRAPSWGNTQPWEVAVLGPSLVRQLGEEFVKKARSGAPMQPDLEMPGSWPEPQRTRYGEVGQALFDLMGIGREDKEARNQHYFNMYRFYGAPNALYLCVDRQINPYYGALDVGALAFGICLAACEKGVGTCTMAAIAGYPDVIREVVGISPQKRIVIGIAAGYADIEHPSSAFRTTRDEGVISWYGF